MTQVVSDQNVWSADCDLSIHYGDISKETAPCRALFHDQIMALSSPEFAQQYPIQHVEDLADIPLIHLEAPESGWTDWQGWTRALGYRGHLRSAHRVNNYVIALQAAQDDIGAVLGWEGLTADLVSSGRLVKLLPDTISSPLDFYVKLHNQASDRAALVYDWLTTIADQ